MIREFRFYRSARRRGLAQTRNGQQSNLFRQPRHRKFEKSVTKRPVSCDSICRNEVTMARHKGRGSPRPSTRASHPSAPCRIQSSLVLHGKHAFLGAFLSLSLVLTFWVPTVAAQGVGTTDEVHVAPRVLPDPAPAKEEVPTGSSFNTHSKPYKTESDLVLVPVTITDPMNRLVTGLDKENFNVFEGKEAQEIKHFSSEDAPVSLGVIFDMSGSMSSKIERAREAVVEFFKTANPQDEFFMVTFADNPEEISDFTQSVEDIQGKLVYTIPKGRTALLDAIYLGEGDHEELILRVGSLEELHHSFACPLDFAAHATTHIEDDAQRHGGVFAGEVLNFLRFFAFEDVEVLFIQAGHQTIHWVRDGNGNEHQVGIHLVRL